jgi:hypothetical protein
MHASMTGRIEITLLPSAKPEVTLGFAGGRPAAS